MAIIDSLEAHVRVGDQNLTEYDPDDHEEDLSDEKPLCPTVKRYIEAQAGQKFRLKFRINRGYSFPADATALMWSIKFDGQYMCGYLIPKEEYQGQGKAEGEKGYRRAGTGDNAWVKQNFQFSGLDITQETISGDRKAVRDKYGPLGSIQILVSPYKVKKLKTDYRTLPVQGLVTSVPEKALKGRAVTLSAGLDAGVITHSRPLVYEGHTVGRSPIANFVFEYRTRKSLQELMIIPRDDEFTVKDEDIDDMTVDELRIALRRERAGREVVQIKDEIKPMIKRTRKTSMGEDEGKFVKRSRTRQTTPTVVVIDSD